MIEDPWRRFICQPDQAGCTVEFDDPDFTAGARDVTYYARALQEPTPAVNAGGLRCTFNDKGECVQVKPCYGDYRTPVRGLFLCGSGAHPGGGVTGLPGFNAAREILRSRR